MQVISRKVCDKKEHAEIPSWVPLEVRELLEMCFTYDPSERPGAAEILEELNNVCTAPSSMLPPHASCVPVARPVILHLTLSVCLFLVVCLTSRLHLCSSVVHLHLAQNMHHSARCVQT